MSAQKTHCGNVRVQDGAERYTSGALKRPHKRHAGLRALGCTLGAGSARVKDTNESNETEGNGSSNPHLRKTPLRAWGGGLREGSKAGAGLFPPLLL